MMKDLIKRTLTALVLIICFFGAYLHSLTLFNFFLGTALGIILYFEWPILFPNMAKIPFVLMTLMYPIFPMCALMFIASLYRDIFIWFPLYPFLISWMYDTMGYLVGCSFGVHKIWPSLSPGKSWEGLFGSFLGVFVGNLIFLQRVGVEPFASIPVDFKYMLVYSVIVTLMAFAGGMFLSYLKRKNNLKDAGSLLPGHGGLLDRFDSIFFVTFLVIMLLTVHFFTRS